MSHDHESNILLRKQTFLFGIVITIRNIQISYSCYQLLEALNCNQNNQLQRVTDNILISITLIDFKKAKKRPIWRKHQKRFILKCRHHRNEKSDVTCRHNHRLSETIQSSDIMLLELLWIVINRTSLKTYLFWPMKCKMASGILSYLHSLTQSQLIGNYWNDYLISILRNIWWISVCVLIISSWLVLRLVTLVI